MKNFPPIFLNYSLFGGLAAPPLMQISRIQNYYSVIKRLQSFNHGIFKALTMQYNPNKRDQELGLLSNK